MKNYLSIKYLMLALLITLGTKGFAQVDACITSPASDTAICKYTWVNLSAANCLNTTSASVSYSWVNLSHPDYPFGPSYSGKVHTTLDSGRWEVTVTNTLDMSTDTDIIHVTYKAEPTAPIFSINGNASFEGKCANSPKTLSATSSASITNYNWYTAGNATSIGSTSTYTINSLPTATDYLVRALYTVTGCTLTDTIYVTNFPDPSPNLGNDIAICSGQSVKLIVGSMDGTHDYAWQGGPFISEDSTFTTSTGGWHKVSVKGPFPFPCTAADSIFITVNPNPTVSTAIPNFICYGDKVVLNATPSGTTGPFTYAWSPKSSLSDSTLKTPTASPVSNTTYTVVVKATSTGCTSSSSGTTNVNPKITASVTFSDSTVCPGSTIQLQGSGSGGTSPYLYFWTPTTNMTGATTATPNITPSATIIHKLEVRDANTCRDTISVSIDMLWVNLGDDVLARIGDSVLLNAANPTTTGFSYSWMDDSGTIISTSSSLYAKTSGNYTVSVSNGSCMVSDSKQITFLADIIQKIWVPNVFSPGLSLEDNSHLKVYGTNVSDENFNFRVFNQWGELVYETNSFTEANSKGWNGMLNNSEQALNTGIYTYTLNGTFLDGVTFKHAGTASLLR